MQLCSTVHVIALQPRTSLMWSHHVKGRLHTMQILLGKSAFATALPAALDPFLASILMVESLTALSCLVWACSRRVIEGIYIAGLVLLCIPHSKSASTKRESDLGQIKIPAGVRVKLHPFPASWDFVTPLLSKYTCPAWRSLLRAQHCATPARTNSKCTATDSNAALHSFTLIGELHLISLVWLEEM